MNVSARKETAIAGTGRGLMLNMATVDPDHEDEFNRWYDEEHLPDVRRRFPQITSARRYLVTDGQTPGTWLSTSTTSRAKKSSMTSRGRTTHFGRN